MKQNTNVVIIIIIIMIGETSYSGCGCYQKNDDYPHVVVTSGVGIWGMVMRVGTDSEVINIRCELY